MMTTLEGRSLDRRFRDLVENATDIIYWMDRKGRLTQVNPMAARITRYAEADLVGKHFSDLIENTHRAAAVVFYQRQYKERRPHTYHEFPVRAANGTTVWLGQNVRTIFDRTGRIDGFEAVARDITERKTLERDRERLIAELKEALARVKELRGLLPICSGCKMVRDDQGYWTQIESYIRAHTNAEFTHGLCPNCLAHYYEHALPPPPRRELP
jgi:PAS domain S-box-containing protein